MSARTLACYAAVVLLMACSPIEPVNTGGSVQRSQADSSSMSDAASDGVGSGEGLARIGATCSVEATHGCSADARSTVAVCKDGTWTTETVCTENERCANLAGVAQCTSVADECVGRKPGVAFCDADAKMRVCIAAGTSSELPCGEHEQCQLERERVRCSCVSGAIRTQAGCEDATSCATQHGGCDSLTTCRMQGNSRVCSACPLGFSGDGATGCKPQLQMLMPSCGALEPSFDPGIYDYKLRVSVLCQSLQLMAVSPSESSLVINGVPVEPGAPWQSALLAVGQTLISVAPTTLSGATTPYRLMVERVGSQRTYLKAGNTDGQDSLGMSVDADGDTVVAGAPYEDSASATNPNNEGAVESGAAYVFVASNGVWSQHGYLKASSPSSLEYFGSCVAISGDTLVVGAPRNDPVTFSVLPTTGKGAAYVFVRSNGAWKEQFKLVGSASQSGDLFGFRVDIQGDTILVSAPFDDVGASHSGAVYEFKRNAGMWSEVQKIKAATPIVNSMLGFSVALSGDTFVAGAAQDSTSAATAGSAYIFVRSAGAWREQQRLEMEKPVAKAVFGWQVALLGDTAVVGAPRVDLVLDSWPAGEAYVFERNAGHWSQTQVLTAAYPRPSDTFGGGLAITGSALLIGGNGDASGSRGASGDQSRSDALRSGAAFLYAKQSGKWVPTAFLKPDNTDRGDNFGQNVALTDDKLVISAPLEASTATGINGDQSLNGAPGSGALYTYE